MEIFERLETLGADVTINPGEVEIETYDKDAYICIKMSEEEPGFIEFDITTFSKTLGTRLPIFNQVRATDIAAAAIEHIGNSEEIAGLEGTWMGPWDYVENRDTRTNWTLYVQRRRALIEGGCDEHEARVRAALSTWTGKNIAVRNGFTFVSRIKENQGRPIDEGISRVDVLFIKP